MRFAEMVPEFTVKTVDWLSVAIYPMSGGFKNWSLVPKSAVASGLALEDRLPRILRRVAGFRLFVVLERG